MFNASVRAASHRRGSLVRAGPRLLSSSALFNLYMEANKKPPHLVEGRHISLILRSMPPDLAPGAYALVAGFQRAVPSTTLDERKLKFTCNAYVTQERDDCQVRAQNSSGLAYPVNST
jgi:hypothetical protein